MDPEQKKSPHRFIDKQVFRHNSLELDLVDSTFNINKQTLAFDKDTFLLFSSYYCGSCRKEHQQLKEVIKGNYRDNFHFYTIMVGVDHSQKSGRQKIYNWKNQLLFSWPIASDPKFELFNRLCPQRKTPCLIHITTTGSFEAYLGKSAQDHFFEFLKSPKPRQKNPKTPPKNSDGKSLFFEGVFSALVNDNKVTQLKLKKDISNPLVVLFSSITCYSCIEEHQNIQMAISDKEEGFIKTNFMSVLVNTDLHDKKSLNDITKWKNENMVNWPILSDPLDTSTNSNPLMQKYCNGLYTPCVSVFIPKKGRIVSGTDIDIDQLKNILKKEAQ